MADNSNGLIYGIASVKFKNKEIGYISQDGLQPAGNAPSFTDIYAAQVQSGPVGSLMSSPGSDAFTFNLIQLKAENLADTVGGTAGADGSWTPPLTVISNGQMDIKTISGHIFRIFNARLSRNGMQNGINMSNVLSFGFRVDMELPADGSAFYKIFPPGVDPDAQPAPPSTGK